MPIFQEDSEHQEVPVERAAMASSPSSLDSEALHLRGRQILARKTSEESIRTELCEGPIPDSPRPTTPEKTSEGEDPAPCSDRAELIERLKRGESPTWVANRHFESIWHREPITPSRSPIPPTNSPSLLPPPTITPEKRDHGSDDEKRLQEGLSIERPRSALHSGDFTQDESSTQARSRGGVLAQNDSAVHHGGEHSWLATSPPRDFPPFHFGIRHAGAEFSNDTRVSSPLSSSLSKSFVYKPPTSPLVQTEVNEDLGLTSPMEGIEIGARNPRRHTLMSTHSGAYGFPSHGQVARQAPSLRHERTYPYQAHQPRRSLTSTPNLSITGTSPQTPGLLRSRLPSFSSDTSPLQHASMVGSYEESILRGRMSTTPSKPLDFVAQIGVLGLGKCKSSLRCPPHVTLPFPAVFYSYATSSHGRSKEDDGPSPYVGQVDLENGLSNPEEDARAKRKAHNRARMAEEDALNLHDGSNPEPRSSQRPKRTSSSPRAPPGGSYRIPEKGQIQIIIKNPNKTAVKLFLVPYDLAGMEPGTKTFIRQRSYSTGPIIDHLPGTEAIGAGDRPILRYLVHLHICSPSKGRYYLYKTIRVVFANRVPDGKERLRNEISLPDPKFTTYKPIRVMHPPSSLGIGPGASLAAEKAFRRRSSGFYIGASSHGLDSTDGISGAAMKTIHQDFSLDSAISKTAVEPVPLRVLGRSSQSNLPCTQDSQPSRQNSTEASSLGNVDSQISRYDKLRKGDVGYGGNAFSSLINGNPGVAEGLLSQRLRTLGVQAQTQHQAQDQQHS
ncbi:hypothetical protein PGQ11_006730 [Apiospora arundinis]|uniref:Atos-like conserved domain-containing protein n=1 Tax=Apiospora arundinis TaxID=335852 RepID=A0ABR2IU59_9PEZI